MPYSLDAILSSDRLPSLPEVAARVVEIARNPDSDFDQLINTIRMDPAIAGWDVLQGVEVITPCVRYAAGI